MQIISHREHISEVSYRLQFDSYETPGWGYSFECDENGNLLATNEAALENYRKVQAQPDKFRDKGVQTYHHSYVVPAVGRCEDCGMEVSLDGFTNTCERCGADYNSGGQRLAPREFWGEETGEHLSDILRIR